MTIRIEIRPLAPADIPFLTGFDPNFTSDSVLDVHKAGAGLAQSWSLIERRLAEPYDKGRRYDLLQEDLDAIARRLAAGDGLYLVAEEAGRIIGLLDMERIPWNNSAWLWNLLVDRAHRRQGLGRQLFQRAIDYARQAGLRVILIETQSNNVPACRFYAAMGCELAGLNDVLYSNEDLELGEVALFWAYRIAGR